MELLVAMGIGMIVLGSLTGTFITQTKFYNAQEQINEMQQNARAAMDLMAREIKLAGYKPSGTAIVGVTYNAAELRIRGRRLMDGRSHKRYASEEHLVYTFDGVNRQIKRAYGAVGSTADVISNNIQAFTFSYLDSAGSATATSANIRQVGLNIMARTAKPDPNLTTNGGHYTYNISTAITSPNLGY